MKITDLKKSIREMIVAELSESTIDVSNPNALTPSQKDTFIKQARTSQKNPSIGTPKDTVDFVEEVSKLEEMAKIAGDLATAIKNVIDDNPELTGLDLKKAIKSDDNVKTALAASGEILHPNQLTRFISLYKGERELGQRGRKVDLGNTLAKKMAELEAQEQSLMNKLNKISQLKKELESSLGVNKIEEDVNFTFQNKLTPAGEIAQKFIKSNPEIKGGKLVKALSSDKEFQKALDKTEKITKKPQKDIYQNQTQKFYDLVMGNRELGQRGRKADPEITARKSEEEKAKEAKRAEKEKARAEKERAKTPAQKPSFPAYKKTTTMVDMSGEPSDKDIEKTEKELGIDIPKVTKPSKLSAEEKDKFDKALKGMNAKIERIKNKEAKPDDVELLKRAYNNADIKKLFKKAGKDIDDLVAGIITTKKDKFDDVEDDEL
jgi:hypothetical protein